MPTKSGSPDIEDVLLHYQKIKSLLNAGVTATGIVDTVILPCAQIYQPIEDDLNYICSKQIGASYVPYFYDWRLDIRTTSAQLATRLQQIASDPKTTSITLICHSMGGLVARLFLESGTTASWFKKIRRLMCICTPHLGAPTALSKCLGLEDDNTISAKDVKTLCDSPSYPAAYQLLPPESRTILWDVSGGTSKPLDYYTAAVAKKLKLSLKNLAVAKQTASLLDLSKQRIDYYFVYGTGHETEESLDLNGSATTIVTDNLGDGTVPIWSASYVTPKIRTWGTPGDHIGILATYAFRRELYRYFGLPIMPPAFAADRPGLVVSLNKRSYSPGETMHVLLIPDVPTDHIEGSLKLVRLAEASMQMAVLTARQITFRGGLTQSVSATITAPAQPGGYRLTFEGTHFTADASAGWFAVTPH